MFFRVFRRFQNSHAIVLSFMVSMAPVMFSLEAFNEAIALSDLELGSVLQVYRDIS